jgi:hypothetical protein
MHSIAPIAISLIVGLSLAAPPARVGAQQPTPNGDTAPVCNLCAFGGLLHMTGRQSVLLWPQDARIIMDTRATMVTHWTEADATYPGADFIARVSASVDASANEREASLRNRDIQTSFMGRNLFAISAENLAKWDVPGLAPGLSLVSGQVTKTFHRATGTDEY